MKNCQYCGDAFKEKRSDAKYCSTRCKNKASVDRRVARESKVHLGSNIPATEELQVLRSLIAEVVNQEPKKIKSQSIDTLSGLLAEKDYSRDLTSELTEYKMKVMYLEDRLKDKEAQIDTLVRRCESHEKEIAAFEKKKKYKDDGFWQTFGHTCSTDPAAAEKMIGAMERTAVGFATMIGSVKSRITQQPQINTPELGSNSVANTSETKKQEPYNPDDYETKDEKEIKFTEEEQKLNKDSEEKWAKVLLKLDKAAGTDPKKWNELMTKLESGLEMPVIKSMLGLDNVEQEE